MTNTQIEYENEAGRSVYAYRPRAPLAAPLIWVWSGIGAVPLGIAGAIIITVLDLTGDFTFAQAAIMLTLLGTVALLVIARLLTRPRVVLRVAFDVLSNTVEIERRHAQPPYIRLTLLDVREFRADTIPGDWKKHCALIMTTANGKRQRLVTLNQPCQPRTGLPDLADRLMMALEAAQTEMQAVPPLGTAAPYVPPTAQRPAMPPTPPRRAMPELDATPQEAPSDERD